MCTHLPLTNMHPHLPASNRRLFGLASAVQLDEGIAESVVANYRSTLGLPQPCLPVSEDAPGQPTMPLTEIIMMQVGGRWARRCRRGGEAHADGGGQGSCPCLNSTCYDDLLGPCPDELLGPCHDDLLGPCH